MSKCPSDSIEILPTADFVLRTFEGTSNNAWNGSITWNNVDIRSILGDLYYKYDYFQLSLKAVIASPLLDATPNSHDLSRVFYMSGLQWQGCNYNTNSTTKPPSLTNKACIGMAGFDGMTTLIGGVAQDSYHIANTFRKGKETTSITIEHYSVNIQTLTAPITVPSGFQGMVYMFKIIPLKDLVQSSANMVLMSRMATSGSTTSSLIWKNYNLKLCMGALWDLYDVFNIELIQYTQDSTNVGDPTGNNETGMIVLSGLPFIPGNRTQVMGLFDFSGPQSFKPVNLIGKDLSIATFSKNQLLADININLWDWIEDNPLVVAGGSYAPGVFIFKITGVKTDALGEVTK